MVAELSTAPSSAPSAARASIADIPKSWTFTSSLPADPQFPTAADSHNTPRDAIQPGLVRGALYTWVRPEPQQDPELLAVSAAAMTDLGIAEGDEASPVFRDTVAGNRLLGWDAAAGAGGYPWAQCYGGWQFGAWAGQLGDGRAISLFETTNPQTRTRYEVQLKGAGITPYSRFADGKAVLRSSIREFVVSEALHALRIPTTRALALSLLPHSHVRRETLEPGAIVARFAESWLRIGTFDLLRARGDRDLTRTLCDYIAENVFGGWEALPGRVAPAAPEQVARGLGKDVIEGPDGTEENRYTRLYREIVRRNATTVAAWQAYGFTNGVLNTDNTSIYGLSIDFGPFAFLDNFDPSYTPNHDDHSLRYAYRNQPTIIWWNLVRLAEALGELLGAGPGVDAEEFVTKGVRAEDAPALIKRAEALIDAVGEEYKAVFLAEYKRLMTARLGLRTQQDGDFEALFSELLDTMEALELDFHHTFRRLSNLPTADLATPDACREVAASFFHAEGAPRTVGDEGARARLGAWLAAWRARVVEDWGAEAEADAERRAAMKKVNPKFVPRGWILDELIQRVEKGGEREILQRVLDMALRPFEDEWGWDRAEEERFCGDVPRTGRMIQCSCSS